MTRGELIDVLIIGGGPAGLSALLWCGELGLSATLIERSSELGGQLLWIHNEIKNYPGRITKSGHEMRDHFLSHFERLKEQVRLNSEMISFDASTVSAALAGGSSFQARSAIIATGLRRRRLGVRGEDEFIGRGILYSGAGQRHEAKGKRVAIIGGGDAAFENAIILSDFAEKIFLIHRSKEVRARREFVDEVQRRANVELLLERTVRSINGGESVRSVELADMNPGTTNLAKQESNLSTLPVDLVLIRVGYEPNTGAFRGQLDMDKNGYILVNASCQTSAPNIFAVGDILGRGGLTIAAAVGDGATAAKAIRESI